MEFINEKAAFLQDEYTKKLKALDETTPPKWGKMNVMQMIEHMSDYVRIASGKIHHDILTPGEHLPRMQAFIMSEKPFRENTPNALMPEEPPVVKHSTKDEAIQELQDELDHFFEVYSTEPTKKIANPFFGMLHYEMQVQLLHKHATHHLRQFGAID